MELPNEFIDFSNEMDTTRSVPIEQISTEDIFEVERGVCRSSATFATEDIWEVDRSEYRSASLAVDAQFDQFGTDFSDIRRGVEISETAVRLDCWGQRNFDEYSPLMSFQSNPKEASPLMSFSVLPKSKPELSTYALSEPTSSFEDIIIVDDDDSLPSLAPSLLPLNPVGSHFETARPLASIVSTVDELMKKCVGVRFVPSECKWYGAAVTSSSSVKFTVRVHRLPLHCGKAGSFAVVFNRTEGDRDIFYRHYSEAQSVLAGESPVQSTVSTFPQSNEATLSQGIAPAPVGAAAPVPVAPITLADVRGVILSNIASPLSNATSVNQGVALLSGMLSSPSAGSADLSSADRRQMAQGLLPVLASRNSSSSNSSNRACMHAMTALSCLSSAVGREDVRAVLSADSSAMNAVRRFSTAEMADPVFANADFGFQHVLQRESANLLCMI